MSFAKNYALIDLSSVVQKYFWTNKDGQREDPTRRALERISREAEGKHIIICCDSKPYFRSTLDPSYKANRPGKDDEIQGSIEMTLAACRERWPVLAMPGMEADDVIASAVNLLSKGLEEKAIEHIVIVSEDTDLLCLLKPGVIWRRVVKLNDEKLDARKRWEIHYDDEPLHPKTPVSPGQVIDYKILTGDDNVHYFEGIGPARAKALLDAFDSYDAILRSVDEFEEDGITPKVQPPIVRASIQTALSTTVETPVGTMNLAELARRMITPVADLKLPPEVFEDGYSVAKPMPVEDMTQPAKAMVLAVPDVQATMMKATHENASYKRALEPKSFDEALKMSHVLYQSKAWPKLFTAGGGPQLVTAIILWAREKNVGLIDALNGAHIIEGTIKWGAHMYIGLTKRSKKCAYFIYKESTSERCTVEVLRHGDPGPQTFTWTIDDAKRAGLVGKTNWKNYPAHMLRARAGMDAARAVFPDVVGASYALEDFDELADASK